MTPAPLPGITPGMPPRAAMRAVAAALGAAGVPDADFDAAELVRGATGRDPRLDRAPLTGAEAGRLAEWAGRRAGREPLQYILGSWDFLDFTLAVGPGVLCPRADSEVVCETAVALLRGGPPAPRVLDLCAGSGCLGLGVRRFLPWAAVRCVEKSPAAYRYLTQNAARALPGAAVEPVLADVTEYWREIPPSSVDLIIANPPYLTAAEMADLMPETAREPAMALDGGADGLDFYRAIARDYRAAVRPGGWLVFEIGCDQGPAVLALGRALGWQNAACRKDYGGNDRVVSFQKGGKAEK